MSRPPGARSPVERREITARIGLPAAPTLTAATSTGSVASALLTGTLPANSPLVWPLVVMVLGSMAYDLGARALGRINK